MVGAEHPSGLWVQVLGREGPFPLILLPQFGGYWIEGTNHQLSAAPESPPTPAPSARAKLEGNHTAKIYRKHFLGKVRLHGCSIGAPWVLHGFPMAMGGLGHGDLISRGAHADRRSWTRMAYDMGAHGPGCPMSRVLTHMGAHEQG